MNRLERGCDVGHGFRRHPVVGPPSALLASEDPGSGEYLQMMAHRRLGEGEWLFEIALADLAGGADQADDSQSGRVGKRFESSCEKGGLGGVQWGRCGLGTTDGSHHDILTDIDSCGKSCGKQVPQARSARSSAHVRNRVISSRRDTVIGMVLSISAIREDWVTAVSAATDA